MKEKFAKEGTSIVLQPEELLYQSYYAPVDLESMLANPDLRSKIRKLPSIHIYFPMKELDDEDISSLLPQITEEQWSGVLDLDLWSRDKVNSDQFLALQRHLLNCEDSVARKLLRGTDAEMWQLLIRRELQVFPRLEEDEFEGSDTDDGSTLTTPDGNYLLVLPQDSEKSRLLRLLIFRLYELVPDWAQEILYSSQFKSTLELEEELFENRKRRIEEMGFLDYYDAIQIFSPLNPEDPLSIRSTQIKTMASGLPIPAPSIRPDSTLFLFRVLETISKSDSLEWLLEDLLLLCNKVLSADQTSPEDPESVQKSIGKALSGASLGLEFWSNSNLALASDGLKKHLLQSFFQMGYGVILQFRDRTLKEIKGFEPSPGSFLEAAITGFTAKYPYFVEQQEGGILEERFFQNLWDLEWAGRIIKQLQGKP